MRTLQVRELAALRGLVAEFVIWKTCSGNDVRSHEMYTSRFDIWRDGSSLSPSSPDELHCPTNWASASGRCYKNCLFGESTSMSQESVRCPGHDSGEN